MNAQAREVLDFWFPDPQPQRAWFVKDEQFDHQIRQRFGELVGQALAGGLQSWDAEGPPSALARILLLDQFTRNIHRGTPLSFAGDAQALAAALDMVDAGRDLALPPLQRAFVYLPLEHAEDLAMQKRCVALFSRLAGEEGGEHLAGMLDYARRHCDVIARFGRFPHRNRILGRASTPEESAFLQQPGSSF
ncbi:DUF924 family protein [Oxalobacteraceae bacterium A2-2]